MKIDSSTIGMESERQYSSTTRRMNRFSVSSNQQGIDEGTSTLLGGFWHTQDGGDNTFENSGEETGMNIRESLEEIKNRMSKIRWSNTSMSEVEDLQAQMKQIRESCLNYLMRILFPDRYKQALWETEEVSSPAAMEDFSNTFGNNTQILQYTRQYYYEETESTSFQTQGMVRTADGREISFQINLNMSRRFQEYYEEQVDFLQTSLCDPLVINLDGNTANVSDQTFFFDLDGDGVEDEISRLIEGSGFLALDQNEDGVINDGSELFGTKSGNGFADLEKYDTDGNGFIDEGDEIFSKLKIWTMDENGEPHLYSLAEKGVGAIGLMHATTNYTLTDEQNNTNGVIRNTGFFLFENGNAGTIQHVDLAKHQKIQQYA